MRVYTTLPSLSSPDAAAAAAVVAAAAAAAAAADARVLCDDEKFCAASALRLKNVPKHVGKCSCYVKMLICNPLFSAMLRNFDARKHLCYVITVLYVLLATLSFFNSNQKVPMMNVDHRNKRGKRFDRLNFYFRPDFRARTPAASSYAAL